MGLGMRVGVYYCGFWEIHLLASSKHVFSNCWSWHIPVPESLSVLCQAMIQCPACPPDVRPRALATGDAVHTHPFLCSSGTGSFGRTNSCFRVRKGQKVNLMAKGLSTLRIDCDRPWMWGIVTDTRAVCSSFHDTGCGRLCLVMKATGYIYSLGATAVRALLLEPGSHLRRKVSLPCTWVSWRLPSDGLLGDWIHRVQSWLQPVLQVELSQWYITASGNSLSS